MMKAMIIMTFFATVQKFTAMVMFFRLHDGEQCVCANGGREFGNGDFSLWGLNRNIAVSCSTPVCWQVFNKLLSLANTVVQPKADLSVWGNLLLSTNGVRRRSSTWPKPAPHPN